MEKTVIIKKETVITVDASQAGTGKVTCRIQAPDNTEIDIDLVENADGTFAILFTPQFPGNYSISIKFGGQSIPEGEYTIQVSVFFFFFLFVISWTSVAHCLVMEVQVSMKIFKLVSMKFHSGTGVGVLPMTDGFSRALLHAFSSRFSPHLHALAWAC